MGDEGDEADPARQVQRPLVHRAVPGFGSRDRPLTDERHHVARRERLAHRQPDGDAGPRGGGVRLVLTRRRRSANLRRRRGEHLSERVVELADAAESGGERHVGQRHRRRLDEQAGGVGALGSGDGERARAEFVGQHANEVSFAVAELPGEARYAAAFDLAVGDQPHGPGDDVLAGVPLR